MNYILLHFYKFELDMLAIGFTSSSLLLINFKQFSLADLGPRPGSFDIIFN